MNDGSCRSVHHLAVQRSCVFLLLLATIGFPLSSAHAGLRESVKDITHLVHSGSKTPAPSDHNSNAIELLQTLHPSSATPLIVPLVSGEDQMAERAQALQRKGKISFGPRFILMLAGDAGFSTPTGDWFLGLNGGFSGGSTVRLCVSDHFLLGFSYRRQWLGVDESLKKLCGYDEHNVYVCIPLEWDVHLDEYYFIFGFMSPVSTYRSPFVYAELGLGGIKHAANLDASIGNKLVSVGIHETKFGMRLNVGGVFPFTKELGLNIEGDMRITGEQLNEPPSSSVNPSHSSSVIAGFLFGFRVGIVVMLGGGH